MREIPARAPALVLRGRTVGAHAGAVMAIINRTTDSFYPGARHDDDARALEAVAAAHEAGAEIIDIGGVRAGTGPDVSVSEEISRVVPFLARVRSEFPDQLVSVDTWRAEVAREAAQAGADLINDTWAGHDPRVVDVAAEFGIGVVCSHTGGLAPRTDPSNVAFPLPAEAEPGTEVEDGVVLDVVATLTRGARRALEAGVARESILIDPTHDFGKTTANSLRLLQRTNVLTELGFPLLMALSRKDFVGETLELGTEDRLEGTLAATAVAAWEGATVFRAHDVPQTRRVLDMVAAIRGDLAPRAPLRGL